MGWYNASWQNRVKVTTLATKVDADLTDFPIYVPLSLLPAGFHTHVNQTDARDIRVTTSDGTTEVPREVVWYDAATDTGELYFKGSPAGATDTDFYIYYNNSGASEPAANATYGSQNTWNSHYQAVWHLHNALGDSTSNGRTLTATNAVDSATGKFGHGRSFDGNNDYLDFTLINPVIGAEFWLKPTAINNVTVIHGVAADTTIQTVDASGHWAMWDGTTYDSTVVGVMTNSAYHHYYFGWNGSNGYKNYKDGAYVEDHTGISQIKASRIGRNTTNAYNGIADEVRFTDTLLTATWLSTQYNNQNSPSTFFTIGAEESGTSIKTIFDLAKASVKTFNGLAIASVKTINGLG